MARSIFSLKLSYSKGLLLIAAIILSVLFGLSDEVYQALIPDRTASVKDVVADGFGSAIGTLFYWKILLR